MLELRKRQLQAAHLSLQPIPVFVGPLIAIDAAYVAVNDVLYKADSALHAVHLCCEIFFSLDSAYPQRAAFLWTFVQVAAFNIHLDADIRNRSLSVLTGEIDHKLASRDAL